MWKLSIKLGLWFYFLVCFLVYVYFIVFWFEWLCLDFKRKVLILEFRFGGYLGDLEFKLYNVKGVGFVFVVRFWNRRIVLVEFCFLSLVWYLFFLYGTLGLVMSWRGRMDVFIFSWFRKMKIFIVYGFGLDFCSFFF